MCFLCVGMGGVVPYCEFVIAVVLVICTSFGWALCNIQYISSDHLMCIAAIALATKTCTQSNLM